VATLCITWRGILNKCIGDMIYNTINISAVEKKVGMIYNSKYKYIGKDENICGYVCNF
jgi:hypothetical protein